MTRQEKRHKAVSNVIKRLRNDGNASDYIQKVLQDQQFRLWLDTWVIAPLVFTNQTDEQLKNNFTAQEDFETGFSLSS